MTPVRATYRLQLGPDLGFDAAAGLSDYLAALGVSHLYASPSLQAEPGSRHGYDVVDPTRVSADLGGEAAWRRLHVALASHGLGMVLDIVPNHMSIAGTSNQWWWDVLENGPSSQHASYFDVDWAPLPAVATAPLWPADENRILLPMLGERYGAALLGGALRLGRDGDRVVVRQGERALPLAPRSLAEPLQRAAAMKGSDELAFLADALMELPLPTLIDRTSTARRHRDKAVIGQLLRRLLEREPALATAVDEVLAAITADPIALDALLERQNWRLTSWKVSTREIGYRRFFDVQTLVGLRVEDPAVFDDTHRLVAAWLRDGVIDGVRVDHVDGLRDPAGYLARLRAAGPEAWIVVEKITRRGEALPDWPVDGTTGYDFMDLVGGVLIDPAGAAPLTALAEIFAGEAQDWPTLVADAKRHVLRHVLGAEVARLSAQVEIAARRRITTRDYARGELSDALVAVLSRYPSYRTYLQPGAPVSDADRALIDEAAAKAAADRDPELIDFLRRLLLLELPGDVETELPLRVQQVTGAIAAKAVEDTAFYRDARLLALDEVGSYPDGFGVELERFHRTMASARPRAMLATSTHDTKRSEDVRARLAVISELPEAWQDAVSSWSQRAARYRRGEMPSRHAEYVFYQTLVGAWPLEEARAWAYLEKAAREDKRHTSWTQPDADYEGALRDFVAGVYADRELMADIGGFVARILDAGRLNSLTQTLIKLTAPGVPDIYQGCELWDLSLVNPDNRRPVDFAARRALLARLDRSSTADILAGMDDGLPKLHIIREALRVRAERPALFEGGYGRLPVRGDEAQRVIAFARGRDLVAVAPRWPLGLGAWGNTTIGLDSGRWHHELTGGEVEGGPIAAATLFGRFPVALLTRME